LAKPSLDWTKNISSDKEKEELIKTLKASTTMRENLLRILNERETTLIKRNYTEDDFNEPNWSEKQAFRNGQLSMINHIKNLLNF